MRDYLRTERCNAVTKQMQATKNWLLTHGENK